VSDGARSPEASVVDNPSAARFEAVVEGHLAELTYRRDGDRLVLLHTGVPDEVEGRGLGGALVRAALDHARANGLTLVPRCPFAARWLESHPDAASDVDIDWVAARR
jgi:predicted GNAT family acetyltransferase